jgi:hypothetical protein
MPCSGRNLPWCSAGTSWAHVQTAAGRAGAFDTLASGGGVALSANHTLADLNNPLLSFELMYPPISQRSYTGLQSAASRAAGTPPGQATPTKVTSCMDVCSMQLQVSGRT